MIEIWKMQLIYWNRITLKMECNRATTTWNGHKNALASFRQLLLLMDFRCREIVLLFKWNENIKNEFQKKNIEQHWVCWNFCVVGRIDVFSKKSGKSFFSKIISNVLENYRFQYKLLTSIAMHIFAGIISEKKKKKTP